MKKCFKCGLEKPLSEFYKHPRMKGGCLGKCKDCTKLDVKNKYRENICSEEFVEKERKRGRGKYHRLYSGLPSSTTIETRNAFRSRFPEKEYARTKLYAVRDRKDGFQYHHWSYNERDVLDVIELTIKDHYKAHRFIAYDSERMMYRRSDNNELLDTKESHEKYIRWCIENKDD
jgi:hypothetical protein